MLIENCVWCCCSLLGHAMKRRERGLILTVTTFGSAFQPLNILVGEAVGATNGIVIDIVGWAALVALVEQVVEEGPLATLMDDRRRWGGVQYFVLNQHAVVVLDIQSSRVDPLLRRWNFSFSILLCLSELLS